MARPAILFFLLLAWLSSLPCRAEEAVRQPYQMIRTAQLLQDAVVRGSNTAAGQQEAMLEQTAQVIVGSPAEVWRDKRNVRALALYLVVKGPPQAVRRIIQRKTDLGEFEKPILALLAFGEGRKEAKNLLGELDAMTMHPAVGAPLALAQGIEFQADVPKAMKYLRIAQLLAPGTLIDEAAARRQISVLLSQKKSAEAIAQAGRYLWRFGSSYYAGGVIAFLANNVLPETATGNLSFPVVQAFMEEVPASQRGGMLLDIVRTSLLAGKLDQVAFISSKATELSKGTAAEEARARLYAAIASSLNRAPEEEHAELKGFDRAALSEEDTAILDAALAVEDRVQAAPLTQDFDDNKDAPEIALTARKTLAVADELLAEDTQ